MNERQARALVIARAGGRCERCGGIGRSIHHRKKRSHLPKGQQWCPTNLVLLCGSGTTGDHGWVEANPSDAEKEGWHVRPWDDPAEIPVKRLRSEWMLLLPDGGMTDGEPPEKGERVFSEETPVRQD